MKTRGLCCCLLMASVVGTSPAYASEPSDTPLATTSPPFRARFSLGLERVFGLLVTRRVTDDGTTRSVQGVTGVSVNTGRSSTFSSPRVAFDYLVANGLTVGGSVWLSTATSRTKDTPSTSGSASGKGESRAFLLSSRFGYLHLFNADIGIWPRAGLSYVSHSASAEGFSDSDSRHLAVTLELPILLYLREHTAISLSPNWDIGVYDREEVAGADANPGTDLWVTDYGLQFGVALFF